MIRNVGWFRKLCWVRFLYDETTGLWSLLAGRVARAIESQGGAFSELHVDQMTELQPSDMKSCMVYIWRDKFVDSANTIFRTRTVCDVCNTTFTVGSTNSLFFINTNNSTGGK